MMVNLCWVNAVFCCATVWRNTSNRLDYKPPTNVLAGIKIHFFKKCFPEHFHHDCLSSLGKSDAALNLNDRRL